MESVFTALRLLASGLGDDGTVFRAAAAFLSTTSAKGSSTAAAVEGGEASPNHKAASAPSSPLQRASCVDPLEVSELYTWGRTKNFQLGFGVVGEEQVIPRLVPFPTAVVVRSVSCGTHHSVAVAADGSVFCWGLGGKTNRLGVEAEDAAHPACIVQPSRLAEFGPGRQVAVKATAGTNHTLALTSAGRVLTWGSNAHGQLGLQGVPTAEGSTVSRPQVVKGLLKAEVITDIAAGAAHSLCCIEGGFDAWGQRPPGRSSGGGVFAWGCNERGALGLGSPPAGPAAASSPSELPHLRDILSVSTHASGHVSGALTARGEAMIFGCSQAAAGDRVPANKASGCPTDGRLFVPSRVMRRRGPGGSGGSADGDEWQTQRASTATTAPPLLSLVLGSSEAFGIDSEGSLWSWSLQEPRPCNAEEVVVTPPSGKGASVWPLKSVGVSSRPGNLWAVDASASARLWRLKRSGEAWSTERCEHLAQVSASDCGPEHQAAIVTFRRPHEQLPAAAESEFAMVTAVDGEETDSDEDSTAGKAPARLFQPASLQELCEQKLCNEVSPRSLGLLCEIALDLHHPALLDHAFAFFAVNAPLMFSRLYLPVLSQLPVEVLSAFELAAAGQFASASAALEAYPEGLPDPLPGSCGGGSPSLPGKAGAAAKQTGQRRKRRSGAGVVSPELQAEAATPPAGHLPPRTTPSSTGLPPSASDLAAKALDGPPAAAISPKAKAEPDAAVLAWVEVRARRKAGIGASPGSPTAPLASPPAPPALARTVGGSGTSPPVGSSGSPATLARPMPTLGDFVRPKLESANAGAEAGGQAAVPRSSAPATCVVRPKPGPSAMLMDAVRSAQALGNNKVQAADKVETGNVDATDTADAAGTDAADGAASAQDKYGKASPCWRALDAPDGPCLRAILEEEDGKTAAGGQPTRGSQAEMPKSCSWGRDAMPSEKAKGESVYEIQQQEKVEKSRRREDDEIREIEAMFAALEVAELAEAEEKEGTKLQKTKAKRPTQGSAKKAAREPKDPETGSQLPRQKSQREHQNGNNKSVKANGGRGPRGGTGGWNTANGWGAQGWGWSDFADWADTAEGSWKRSGQHPERGLGAVAAASGGGRRWVRKDASEAAQEAADG